MSVEKSFLILATILAVSCSVNGWGVSDAKPEFGRCPTPAGMGNFSTYEFEGAWKVRYQFQCCTYSMCSTLTFTPKSNSLMDINISDRVSSRLNVETDGKSITQDPSKPASMMWTWNYFPSQTEYVTVMDTDYDHYAILFLCQDYFLFHQPRVVILSKHEELPSIYVTRAKNLVQSFHPAQPFWKPGVCTHDVYSPVNETETKSFAVDKTLSKILNIFKPLFPQ